MFHAHVNNIWYSQSETYANRFFFFFFSFLCLSSVLFEAMNGIYSKQWAKFRSARSSDYTRSAVFNVSNEKWKREFPFRIRIILLPETLDQTTSRFVETKGKCIDFNFYSESTVHQVIYIHFTYLYVLGTLHSPEIYLLRYEKPRWSESKAHKE